MIEHPYLMRALDLPCIEQRVRGYIEQGLHQAILAGDCEAIRDWMDALEIEESLANLTSDASLN